jgi:two-component system, sensor histidine kinase PdtaS
MYELTGNYKKALEEIQTIEKKAKINKNTQQIITAFWYEARVYYGLCREAIKKQDSNLVSFNYSKAITYYINALKLETELKDSISMVFFYYNLGFIYDKCNLITDGNLIKETNLIKVNYYQKALEADLVALKISKKLNNNGSVMDCYANLALFYRNQGDLLYESGKLSLSKSNYKVSLAYYLKVLAIIKKLGFKHGIANYNKELGVAYFKLGKLDDAKKYISAGAKGFDEMGFKDGAKECYEKLSEVDYKKRDYKNAFEDYKKFSAFKDSMISEVKSKQLIEMDIKYETEKKEDSLRLQQKLIAIKNRSITQQNYFLIGLAALALIIAGFFIVSRLQSKKIGNQYKEIVQLQSELTHRTGNFFNSIKSMLSVALTTTSDKETIASIDKRVNTINHLFKTLYSSPNGQYVTFTKLLNSICDDFEHSFENEKNIHIYRKANAAVSKEEAVPLAFIIAELLTNSYKHAFKNTPACEIHVEVHKDATKRILHIWDNGEGLPDTIRNTAEIQQGMSIIKSYCKTLGGKMSSWNDKGFHFKMEF